MFHVRKPNMKTRFFLQSKVFSDIIAFVEKHKTIHTRFGMNDLFFLGHPLVNVLMGQIPKEK